MLDEFFGYTMMQKKYKQVTVECPHKKNSKTRAKEPVI